MQAQKQEITITWDKHILVVLKSFLITLRE